jgi:hypothetical protein
MAFSGMLRRVALVRTDISEESSASFIRVTSIYELGTTLAVTINRRTLMKEALSFFETLVLTSARRRNIPEDAILHSHRRENLKSYRVIMNYNSECPINPVTNPVPTFAPTLLPET